MGFSKLLFFRISAIKQHFHTFTMWGIVLFLVFYFYQHISEYTLATELFMKNGTAIMVVIILLSLLQHSIEVYKMYLCLPEKNWMELSYAHVMGISYSIIGPGIVMEYAAKLRLFNNTMERATLLGSVAINKLAQGVPTILFGSMSILYVANTGGVDILSALLDQWHFFDSSKYLLMFLLILLPLLFLAYRVISVQEVLAVCKDSVSFVISANHKLLFQLTLLSSVRYLVYIVQYVLFFVSTSFSQFNWLLLASLVACTFIIRMLMPSSGGLQDVLWRVLLGGFLGGICSISFTVWSLSVSVIWACNHVLPTCAGFCLGLIYRRQ